MAGIISPEVKYFTLSRKRYNTKAAKRLCENFASLREEYIGNRAEPVPRIKTVVQVQKLPIAKHAAVILCARRGL